MYKTGLIFYRKLVVGMSAEANSLPVSGHSDVFFCCRCLSARYQSIKREKAQQNNYKDIDVVLLLQISLRSPGFPDRLLHTVWPGPMHGQERCTEVAPLISLDLFGRDE